ncbi:yippee zinc-binding/DNA-binding /Mis18, centromere assembly-domain-containing protein [Lipomyces tetrasporus]|uniref:Yippee zinc-binding/DNA-binding /Mis18, centromere assembly-domain-containing protein n=1 Tax=Lipomyces tetrasporus TaxID=54092 RepID=A0AAD7QN14_9ASCO|nr:yippee zinc-binding/DNA-binding /Mis18, centromere assembly-domain-containing protein [Lipomyces tetrasporus]KAJ8097896.1 yippee zinc-binding/DNA-binding /Mis18, centromere assembly-domain-containing protein [Lipomyces tetrasporus]
MSRAGDSDGYRNKYNNGNEVSEGAVAVNPSAIVFQCLSCLQIVADSTTWVRATPELRTFTLQSAPADTIMISEQLSTSHEGHDLGSTYASFSCSNCTHVLGKIYRTTPRYLDDLRDYFTFDASALKNYQIGSDEPANGPPPADTDFAILKPEPDAVAQRLAIMETVIMAMHDEVEQLKSEVASLRNTAAVDYDSDARRRPGVGRGSRKKT